MITIEPTEQERASGVLSDGHRHVAAEALEKKAQVVEELRRRTEG